MTVYFSNPGEIDLDVIRVMGVNVKNTENPIGYFGTGLKFAIATLLRTGHRVTLFVSGQEYKFTARESEIRGKQFKRVYMNDEPLGFTTQLGKNWEVWQAYRELHSNTIDESGTISAREIGGDTVIKVEGDAFKREYNNRDQIFVTERKPIAEIDGLQVFEGSTSYVYYRGVRAGAVADKFHFTYNITREMELTEDRTLKSQFDMEWELSRLIPKLTHKGVIVELLDGGTRFDQSLDFTRCSSPSRQFLEVAASRYSDHNAPAAAKKLVERDMQSRGDYKDAVISGGESQKFLDSFGHLQNLGCTLSPEDVRIVDTLGPNVMGLYHKEKDQVFLAKSTLDWGLETVVATLYEEWLHKDYHYKDKSRELQNFLFQRLVAMSMGGEAPQPERQVGGFLF